MNDIKTIDTFFLPNLCDVRMVFSVVVIGELLAFLLALAPFTGGTDQWTRLSLASLFIQWVGLTSAALLCLLRPALARLKETTAASLCYALLIVITGVFSEIAYRVAQHFSPGWEVTPAWHVQLVGRNVMLSAIVSAVVLRYFYVQHKWKMQTKAEAQARVEALQARIRPHFLFNSMNTIAALTRSDPVAAEAAVENLADLFRQSFADSRNEVKFSEELELSRRYLSIEQLRLGDRLKVTWDVDSISPDTPVPPLTLQPLLENAIYHGIEPSITGGTIAVRAETKNNLIHIEIVNPLPPETARTHSGNNIALENIRLRIEALYPELGRLEVRAEGDVFRAHLTLPAQGATA